MRLARSRRSSLRWHPGRAALCGQQPRRLGGDLDPGAAAGVTVTGTGSSYAAVAINNWVGQVANLYGLSINYQTSSSVLGAPELPEQRGLRRQSEIGYSRPTPPPSPRPGSYQYLPDVAGAQCLMYNLQSTTSAADREPAAQLGRDDRDLQRSDQQVERPGHPGDQPGPQRPAPEHDDQLRLSEPTRRGTTTSSRSTSPASRPTPGQPSGPPWCPASAAPPASRPTSGPRPGRLQPGGRLRLHGRPRRERLRRRLEHGGRHPELDHLRRDGLRHPPRHPLRSGAERRREPTCSPPRWETPSP